MAGMFLLMLMVPVLPNAILLSVTRLAVRIRQTEMEKLVRVL
jgi:hypothetical protein